MASMISPSVASMTSRSPPTNRKACFTRTCRAGTPWWCALRFSASLVKMAVFKNSRMQIHSCTDWRQSVSEIQGCLHTSKSGRAALEKLQLCCRDGAIHKEPYHGCKYSIISLVTVTLLILYKLICRIEKKYVNWFLFILQRKEGKLLSSRHAQSICTVSITKSQILCTKVVCFTC